MRQLANIPARGYHCLAISLSRQISRRRTVTQFHGKTKICYGRYALETLEELPSTSAFVVTDPFMVKSGFAEQVTSHLERRGLPHLTFAEVEPDPSLETVMRGTLDFIRSKADLIVALGGGSAIDTAKAIAFFARKAAPDLPRPLLAAIPTTSGTGSEGTAISVGTDKKQGVKIPLNDELLIPDVAILDARFTRTVPPHVTAATGMDVLTHALEAYTSRENNAFTDILAVQAIRYVFSFLLKAYQQMEDMEAREMMLLGSCMAGMPCFCLMPSGSTVSMQESATVNWPGLSACPTPMWKKEPPR